MISAISILSLPEKVDENEEDNNHIKCQNDASRILKSLTPPIIILGLVVMPTVAIDEAFVGNFLVVYMKNEYQEDVEVTGMILTICGIFYSLATMVLGYCTDKGLSRALTIMVGFLVLTIGTLLIDISIFGAAWPSYVYSGIMFGIVEIGSAMVQVSILPLLVFHDPQTDQERSTETMAGVYNSGFFIGAFAGPLVGSAILHFVSFPLTFTIFAASMFVVLLIVGGANLKIKNLLNLKEKSYKYDCLLADKHVP